MLNNDEGMLKTLIAKLAKMTHDDVRIGVNPNKMKELMEAENARLEKLEKEKNSSSTTANKPKQELNKAGLEIVSSNTDQKNFL